MSPNQLASSPKSDPFPSIASARVAPRKSPSAIPAGPPARQTNGQTGCEFVSGADATVLASVCVGESRGQNWASKLLNAHVMFEQSAHTKAGRSKVERVANEHMDETTAPACRRCRQSSRRINGCAATSTCSPPAGQSSRLGRIH